MRPEWRIYYRDGAVYDNLMGKPEQAPGIGVVSISGYYSEGSRYMMNKWDFYRWDPSSGEWWGQDMWGILDWAEGSGIITSVHTGSITTYHTYAGEFQLDGLFYHLRQHGLLKWGSMVTNEEFGRVISGANCDPDFPKRRPRDDA